VSRAAPERRRLRLKSHGKPRRLKSLRAATLATLQGPSFAMRPQPQVTFHYFEAHPRRSGDPARPTIVRRGRARCLARRRGRVGCRAPAAIDARRTGARTGRAPVHSAQPADHFSCIAVRPRPPAPLLRRVCAKPWDYATGVWTVPEFCTDPALLRRTRVLLPEPLSHGARGCQGTHAPHRPPRRRGPHPQPLSLTRERGAACHGVWHHPRPFRESRLGCRSAAQRDQSAWGGGEGENYMTLASARVSQS